MLNNYLIQQGGGGGGGGQLVQTRWLITALPFKAKGGVIIVRALLFLISSEVHVPQTR